MSGRYLTWIHVLVLLYIYSGEAYGCANQAPTAAIGNTNPQYSCKHRPVGFYSESEDPDGSIVLHEWDFPPGASEISGTWLTKDNCSSGDCEVSPPADLCGRYCHEANCVFTGDGVYTVKLRVKDNDGAWSAWAQCPVYVADVVSVGWNKYHPDNPDLEAHPAIPPNGGLRIFPGKKDYDDTAEEEAMRAKVLVNVKLSHNFGGSIPSPGMPVYVDWWDVDDPSADDAGLT